jgi:hypothetical protein
MMIPALIRKEKIMSDHRNEKEVNSLTTASKRNAITKKCT